MITHMKSIRILLVLLFLFSGTALLSENSVSAQPDVSLEVNLQQNLRKAQVLSLATLGIDRRGRGQTLARMIITNNETDRVSDLYFNVYVKTSRVGLIAEVIQEQGRPFSLAPNQIIITDNNMIQDGIQDIREKLVFEGEITTQGEDFINDLEGSTTLPNDVYTLEVIITQGANLESGGTEIASAVATLGGDQPSVETRDIYLVAPGGTAGTDNTLSNALPEFNWDGESGINYRLIVVEDNGVDSYETLISSARSSEPAISDDPNTPATGSLFEYENVDAIVTSSNFQMPPSGVQELKPGNTYYWQVIGLLSGAGQTQEITSDVWEFSISENAAGTGGSANEATQNEIFETLRLVIGPEQVTELQNQGYRLQAITIGGVTYRSSSVIRTQLANFADQIRSGEITVIVEQ